MERLRMTAKGVTSEADPHTQRNIGSSSSPSFVSGLKPFCIGASRLGEGGGRAKDRLVVSSDGSKGTPWMRTPGPISFIFMQF